MLAAVISRCAILDAAVVQTFVAVVGCMQPPRLLSVALGAALVMTPARYRIVRLAASSLPG